LIPGTYDFSMYRGDYYYGPVIPLFSLAPWGGPSNPTENAELIAQIRKKENDPTILAVFDVDVLSTVEMTIRLIMDKEQTKTLPSECRWDIQAEFEGKSWTPLRGAITMQGQVTEVEA
jgi:hypothetical protein